MMTENAKQNRIILVKKLKENAFAKNIKQIILYHRQLERKADHLP